MDLCYGHSHISIRLRATKKYLWEELRDMCTRVSPPYCLRVEGTLIPLVGQDALDLGCKVSAAYHDWVAYNATYDDGFDECGESEQGEH